MYFGKLLVERYHTIILFNCGRDIMVQICSHGNVVKGLKNSIRNLFVKVKIQPDYNLSTT